MILTGTLVNTAAIAVGGLAGTFGGKLLPARMKNTLLSGAGLLSIGIGVSGLSSGVSGGAGISVLAASARTPSRLRPCSTPATR